MLFIFSSTDSVLCRNVYLLGVCFFYGHCQVNLLDSLVSFAA